MPWPARDPSWAKVDRLPRIADHAERLAVFSSGRAVLSAGPVHLGVFPVATDGDVVGVLEIRTQEALDAAGQRLIRGILRLYSNFQTLLDYSKRDTLRAC